MLFVALLIAFLVVLMLLHGLTVAGKIAKYLTFSVIRVRMNV